MAAGAIAEPPEPSIGGDCPPKNGTIGNKPPSGS
jgi:hypothetical protein